MWIEHKNIMINLHHIEEIQVIDNILTIYPKSQNSFSRVFKYDSPKEAKLKYNQLAMELKPVKL